MGLDFFGDFGCGYCVFLIFRENWVIVVRKFESFGLGYSWEVGIGGFVLLGRKFDSEGKIFQENLIFGGNYEEGIGDFPISKK